MPQTEAQRRYGERRTERARAQRALAPHTHVVIPDTQSKPGAPIQHFMWIGAYLHDQFADKANVTVVHLGDHWDMPSLSSYDEGKKSMEGRRVAQDIDHGNLCFDLLSRETSDCDFQRYLLRGNHEDRITRAVESNPKLDGLLSLDNLQSPGWEVVPYREVVELDGVHYSHYFYNPMTGRPYGGQSIDTRLKTIGYSFTMGHQQTLMYGMRPLTNGQRLHGLVSGVCYLHDEEYLGPQGNAQWRGIVVCHQVKDGAYDPMFVSLEYLCARYEGMKLSDFKDRYCRA